jgi:hypothetical protein
VQVTGDEEPLAFWYCRQAGVRYAVNCIRCCGFLDATQNLLSCCDAPVGIANVRFSLSRRST